jgi:hypothetical protein
MIASYDRITFLLVCSFNRTATICCEMTDLILPVCLPHLLDLFSFLNRKRQQKCVLDARFRDKREINSNVHPCVTGHPAWRDAIDNSQPNTRNNGLEAYKLSG